MAEVDVIFDFKGKQISIKCKPEETLKVACEKFCRETRNKKEYLTFFYGDICLIEKKKTKIYFVSMKKIQNQPTLKHLKVIVCV